MLGDRLKEARKKLNLSQIELAKILNISKSYMSEIESNKSIPGGEILSSIKTNFGVSIDWLLTGTGSMMLGEENMFPSGSEFQDDIMPIPFYNAQAAAGCGAINDNVYIKKFIPFSKRYIKEVLGILHKNLSLICVRGDSMEPTLKQGDLLLINELQKTPDDEGIYVFRQAENISVKRISILNDDEIKIISDNKVYDSYVINYRKDPIDIIGKVAWHAKKVV